jgi:DNA-directed RNA polymerase specialized sigma24 family protein
LADSRASPAFPSRRRQAVADEALIRSVFEEHGRALLAYATRLLGDRQTAEDVVQEALVRAWRHPEADAIVEIYFKGSSVAQAAAALGIPEGTVRSRCYYALRSLRAWAGSYGVLEGVSG